MSEKHCVDCTHLEQQPQGFKAPRCTEAHAALEPARSGGQARYHSAVDMRRQLPISTLCGPTAQFFEAKPTEELSNTIAAVAALGCLAIAVIMVAITALGVAR